MNGGAKRRHEKSLALHRTLRAVSTIRLNERGLDEIAIHDRVSASLKVFGISYHHEYVLGPRARVDFFTDDGIVIEVKKLRPALAAVTKQLCHYASFGAVQALVLVLERHIDVPNLVDGKPIRVVSLNRQWGIAV